MTQFFSELAKWDTLDGDESVHATMNAGTGFMLSFMGQQDKAEQITDVLMYVMNFIGPFEKYVNPMNAMTVISEVLGGTIPAVGNFFDMVENAIGDGVSTVVETFMGIAESIAGNTPLPDEFDMELPTMGGVQNFLSATGFSNELINGVIDGISSDIGENVGDIIGFTGLTLAILTWSYTYLFGVGAARIGSLVVGGISVLIQSIAILGNFGIGGTVALTTLGLVGGIFSVIFWVMGVTESGTSPTEMALIGACFTIDIGGFVYVCSR